ncbi:MAG: formamidopyrimidine-DNA glycosylase [Chloroflexi bacterium RBG_13_51_36]|nr:MAG: formamidopyrimidine-DNA glycosylase [Chloroflexi bacterium RBG_13_51_36]
MIELPEAAVLAEQISKTVVGKRIKNVIAAQTPHKLAWYFGDPQEYKSLLTGKVISGVTSYGGQVEISAGMAKLLFSDGVNLRYYNSGEKLPDKHQLLLEFDDGSHLVGWVQMYGGLSAFPGGKNDNKYYLIAQEKPSPLSGDFDEDYFRSLFDQGTAKLSLKAFLATEQRIPGLGNGVLQDILFNAKMHPKKRAGTLSATDQKVLFDSIKNTFSEMTAKGGRDTENDILGKPGAYKTRLSKNTVGQPCPICGTLIKKEAYLGGSIYYCARCQRI